MCINVDVWRVINSQRKMVRAEDRIAAALLNRYRILVFFACRPFGIPLHPVDVSLAAGGGDGDERCALSHALRDEVDSPCVPSRPPFFIGVILRLYSVSGGTFPARRFTVSSR